MRRLLTLTIAFSAIALVTPLPARGASFVIPKVKLAEHLVDLFFDYGNGQYGVPGEETGSLMSVTVANDANGVPVNDCSPSGNGLNQFNSQRQFVTEGRKMAEVVLGLQTEVSVGYRCAIRESQAVSMPYFGRYFHLHSIRNCSPIARPCP